jgi:hypothetical protein
MWRSFALELHGERSEFAMSALPCWGQRTSVPKQIAKPCELDDDFAERRIKNIQYHCKD